jgi:hypothetical protein
MGKNILFNGRDMLRGVPKRGILRRTGRWIFLENSWRKGCLEYACGYKSLALLVHLPMIGLMVEIERRKT